MGYADLGQAEGITHQEHRKQGKAVFFSWSAMRDIQRPVERFYYGNEKMILACFEHQTPGIPGVSTCTISSHTNALYNSFLLIIHSDG